MSDDRDTTSRPVRPPADFAIDDVLTITGHDGWWKVTRVTPLTFARISEDEARALLAKAGVTLVPERPVRRVEDGH